MSARIGVLISGSGSNLQALIDGVKRGVIDGEIVLVVSNRRNAYGLERARAASIPTLYHPLAPYRREGRSRRQYDADLAEMLAAVDPDWIVLAGWMHILSSAFLDRFPNRVINLHPALPGAFPGATAIEDALNAFGQGAIEQTGVMVHLVPDEAVDAGPVLAQQAVPIQPEDTLETLKQRIHRVEHELLVSTIARLAND